jgi:hypothetical protein
MVAIKPKILQWKRQQPRGAIMKPKTFSKIESNAIKQGYTKEQAQKIAGRAYWNTVQVKSSSHSKGYERRV